MNRFPGHYCCFYVNIVEEAFTLVALNPMQVFIVSLYLIFAAINSNNSDVFYAFYTTMEKIVNHMIV